MTGKVLQSLIARLLAMGGGLLTMVMASRLLGPEGKGQYSYLMAVLGLGVQVGSFGMGTANLYFASKDRTALGRLAANSIIASLLAATVVAAALGMASVFWQRVVPFDAGVVLLLAIAVFLGLVWASGQNILVGGGFVGWFNALTIIYSLLLAGAMVSAFVWASGAARQVAVAQVACSGIAAVSLVLILRRVSQSGMRPDPALMRQSLFYGLAVYAAQMFIFLATRVDLLVVQYQLSQAELGLYSLASDVCNVIIQLQAIANLLLFPHLARLSAPSDRIRTSFGVLWRAAAVYLVAVLLAVIFLEDIVGLVFGVAFVPAAGAVLLLMPGIVFLALASILHNHLAAAGWPKAMMFPPICGFLVSLSLNLWLVRKFGIKGAAVSSSIGYAATLVVACALVVGIERRQQSPNP